MYLKSSSNGKYSIDCQSSGSSFTDSPLTRHSENSAAINNRYLSFVQMRGLILLVNDNHVDNNLKEILEYLYLGPNENSRSKTTENLPGVSIS